MRQNFEFVPRQLLDFLEKLRCCVPWENSPLEHDRLSVNVVQLAILQGLKRNTQFFPVSMLFGDRGSSGNFPPRHSTGSEKTRTSAFNCSNIVTCNRVQDFHGLRLQSSLHGSTPTQKKRQLSQTLYFAVTHDGLPPSSQPSSPVPRTHQSSCFQKTISWRPPFPAWVGWRFLEHHP